ncbi:hypothetical protein WR25_15357 [Diploscapter pachys]|uniref:Staphylococcal nuclease domain-containing protein 1 n=1 Tax=Diploscapter pachys TaxID=2018661 RepID=A0A2A2M1L6_9BILA|nr:hypothetical protein WR25_15357 [Diploscapter pachys]
MEGRSEPYAEEAKFFVEQRLLQQDVQVVLESTSNNNLVGSIIHPKGNIAESLLREGYAKQAKEKRMRLWKAYAPSAASSGDRKSFSAKVLEVVLSDSLIVQKDDGQEMKIHLSSIRLPRDPEDKPVPGRPFRPLYDIPFMFQAREYLRKKCIGKKVAVTIDYVQAASEQFPEKTCCTVKVADTNLAEALLQRGLAKAVRHRSDDENRSAEYDALLAAEATAEKEKKGLFAERTDAKTGEKKGTQRITEVQGDLAKSKQFLSTFQRTGKVEGVVEFVTSGSRFRVYIPKESVVITFLLGGINCPKGARSGASGPAGQAEPYSDEATAFSRKAVLQREVELEMEALDKTGNFIGYMFVPQTEGGRPQNLSELLLTEGLASLHFTAERSSHYTALSNAEAKARNARKNIWTDFKEEKVDEQAEQQAQDTSERKVNFRKFAVTEVQKGALRFYAQNVDDGPKLEKLTSELREHLKNNEPVPGAYNARRGDLCAAVFSLDGQWYRARIESIKMGVAEVLFVDYGNRQSMDVSKLAQLPGQFASFPPAAKEFAIALAAIPNDKEYANQCTEVLTQYLFEVGTIELNVEYRVGTLEYVQVMIDLSGKRTDLAKDLVENGWALADKRREARLQNLVEQYAEAEKQARRRRLNIWEFGDFTGSEI